MKLSHVRTKRPIVKASPLRRRGGVATGKCCPDFVSSAASVADGDRVGGEVLEEVRRGGLPFFFAIAMPCFKNLGDVRSG